MIANTQPELTGGNYSPKDLAKSADRFSFRHMGLVSPQPAHQAGSPAQFSSGVGGTNNQRYYEDRYTPSENRAPRSPGGSYNGAPPNSPGTPAGNGWHQSGYSEQAAASQHYHEQGHHRGTPPPPRSERKSRRLEREESYYREAYDSRDGGEEYPPTRRSSSRSKRHDRERRGDEVTSRGEATRSRTPRGRDESRTTTTTTTVREDRSRTPTRASPSYAAPTNSSRVKSSTGREEHRDERVKPSAPPRRDDERARSSSRNATRRQPERRGDGSHHTHTTTTRTTEHTGEKHSPRDLAKGADRFSYEEPPSAGSSEEEEERRREKERARITRKREQRVEERSGRSSPDRSSNRDRREHRYSQEEELEDPEERRRRRRERRRPPGPPPPWSTETGAKPYGDSHVAYSSYQEQHFDEEGNERNPGRWDEQSETESDRATPWTHEPHQQRARRRQRSTRTPPHEQRRLDSEDEKAERRRRREQDVAEAQRRNAPPPRRHRDRRTTTTTTTTTRRTEKDPTTSKGRLAADDGKERRNKKSSSSHRAAPEERSAGGSAAPVHRTGSSSANMHNTEDRRSPQTCRQTAGRDDYYSQEDEETSQSSYYSGTESYYSDYYSDYDSQYDTEEDEFTDSLDERRQESMMYRDRDGVDDRDRRTTTRTTAKETHQNRSSTRPGDDHRRARNDAGYDSFTPTEETDGSVDTRDEYGRRTGRNDSRRNEDRRDRDPRKDEERHRSQRHQDRPHADKSRRGGSHRDPYATASEQEGYTSTNYDTVESDTDRYQYETVKTTKTTSRSNPPQQASRPRVEEDCSTTHHQSRRYDEDDRRGGGSRHEAASSSARHGNPSSAQAGPNTYVVGRRRSESDAEGYRTASSDGAYDVRRTEEEQQRSQHNSSRVREEEEPFMRTTRHGRSTSGRGDGGYETVESSQGGARSGTPNQSSNRNSRNTSAARHNDSPRRRPGTPSRRQLEEEPDSPNDKITQYPSRRASPVKGHRSGGTSPAPVTVMVTSDGNVTVTSRGGSPTKVRSQQGGSRQGSRPVSPVKTTTPPPGPVQSGRVEEESSRHHRSHNTDPNASSSSAQNGRDGPRRSTPPPVQNQDRVRHDRNPKGYRQQDDDPVSSHGGRRDHDPPPNSRAAQWETGLRGDEEDPQGRGGWDGSPSTSRTSSPPRRGAPLQQKGRREQVWRESPNGHKSLESSRNDEANLNPRVRRKYDDAEERQQAYEDEEAERRWVTQEEGRRVQRQESDQVTTPSNQRPRRPLLEADKGVMKQCVRCICYSNSVAEPDFKLAVGYTMSEARRMYQSMCKSDAWLQTGDGQDPFELLVHNCMSQVMKGVCKEWGRWFAQTSRRRVEDAFFRLSAHPSAVGMTLERNPQGSLVQTPIKSPRGVAASSSP